MFGAPTRKRGHSPGLCRSNVVSLASGLGWRLRACVTARLGVPSGANCHYGSVASVTRLVTFVDVDDDAAHDRQVSYSVRHEAVLVDGRHVPVLLDRGWSESGPSDIWARTSVAHIVDIARMVVGPDEPFDGRSYSDMEAEYWAMVTEVLRQQGIVEDVRDVRRLQHDVVLSNRLLARAGLAPVEPD